MFSTKERLIIWLNIAESSNKHNEGKNDHLFSNMEVIGEIFQWNGFRLDGRQREQKNIHSSLEKFNLEGNLNVEWYLLLYVYQIICLKQFLHALVSCGCSNKIPQTWWLKTTHIYPSIVLEAINLKSASLGQNEDVGETIVPLEALGKNPFVVPSIFWWLLAFLGLCPHHSSLGLYGHIGFLLFCMCQLSLCLSPVSILVTDSNPGGFPHLKKPNLITSPKTLFPYKMMLIGEGHYLGYHTVLGR